MNEAWVSPKQSPAYFNEAWVSPDHHIFIVPLDLSHEDWLVEHLKVDVYADIEWHTKALQAGWVRVDMEAESGDLGLEADNLPHLLRAVEVLPQSLTRRVRKVTLDTRVEFPSGHEFKVKPGEMLYDVVVRNTGRSSQAQARRAGRKRDVKFMKTIFSNPIRPKEGARYRYDPIGWDRVDPKPFGGGTPIAPGSLVTVIGGVGGRFGGKRGPMSGTLKFVWVRDTHGQEQSVSPGSLFPIRKISQEAMIWQGKLGIKEVTRGNPHRSYSVWEEDWKEQTWVVSYGHGTFQDSIDVAILPNTGEERSIAAAEALNAAGRETDYHHAADWLKTHGWPQAEAIAGLDRARIEDYEKNDPPGVHRTFKSIERSTRIRRLVTWGGAHEFHMHQHRNGTFTIEHWIGPKPMQLNDRTAYTTRELADAAWDIVSGKEYDGGRRAGEASSNPYSSKATYWHFRVLPPGRFVRFRTRTPGHGAGIKLVIGFYKGKHGGSALQKILIPKASYPTIPAATARAKEIVDRQAFQYGNPPGDAEMPEIYGRTHKITMTKTAGRYKGQKFYHNFGASVTQHGVPEGSTLHLPSGRRVEIPRRSVILQGPKGLWGHYT